MKIHVCNILEEIAAEKSEVCNAVHRLKKRFQHTCLMLYIYSGNCFSENV